MTTLRYVLTNAASALTGEALLELFALAGFIAAVIWGWGAFVRWGVML